MTNKRTPPMLLGLVLLVLAAAAITPASAIDASNNPLVKRQSGAAACVQCLIGPRPCHPACASDQVCAFVPKTCTECAKSACVPKDKIPDGWLLFPSTATAPSDGATSSPSGTDAATTTSAMTGTDASATMTATGTGPTAATITSTGATSYDATPAPTAQAQANATKGATATAAGAMRSGDRAAPMPPHRAAIPLPPANVEILVDLAVAKRKHEQVTAPEPVQRSRIAVAKSVPPCIVSGPESPDVDSLTWMV
ncbi:hypothetical protein GGF32_009636 [Allomyces javanicus]|nr:hypothetical protein GGF32_009636 [Allomyces javanicus]